MTQEGEGIPDQNLYKKFINQMFDRLRMDLATQIGDLENRSNRMESSYQGGIRITNTKNHGRHE